MAKSSGNDFNILHQTDLYIIFVRKYNDSSKYDAAKSCVYQILKYNKQTDVVTTIATYADYFHNIQFLEYDKSNVEINIILNDIHVTATAFLVISLDKFLLNITTSFLFLIDAIATANSDTIVIVLIPPAVPTGLPPININIKLTKTLEFVKFS